MMQQRMGQAASNTAAAGGMRGSPYEQQQQQELVQSLLSKDMQQYLQNVVGQQQSGLSGEQNLSGFSAQAGLGLGSNLANISGSQGSLAYQQAAGGGEKGALGPIMGVAGGVIGGIYGGPAGAQAGSSIGSGVGGAMAKGG